MKMQLLQNKTVLKPLKLFEIAILIVFIIVSCTFVLGAEGHFEKLYPDYPVYNGESIKLKNGKILMDSGLIFDPDVNKFVKTKTDKRFKNGILLKDGKILYLNPINSTPSMQFYKEIDRFLMEDFAYKMRSKKEFYKTTLSEREQKYKRFRKNYFELSEEERTNFYLPYIKKDPDLLKKYNDYIAKSEESMFGLLFDTTTYSFSKIGKFHFKIIGNKILLDDGRVLIFGRANYQDRNSQIEIYNPDNEKFTLLETDKKFSSNPLAIKLDNGKIFIVDNKKYLFYDSISNKFSKEKPLPLGKYLYFTKLNDGRLIYFTGKNNDATDIIIYDPSKDKFLSGGHLVISRGGDPQYPFGIVVLSDNRVLIFGGIEKRTINGHVIASKSVEIYDPSTGISKPIGNMHFGSIRGYGYLLDDKRVLLYNGISKNVNQIELYIPKDYKFKK